MNIFVISLARAQERRKRIQQQFAAYDLGYEFLDATDGRALTPAERALVDHGKRQSVSPHLLSDNEIACFISHRRAMFKLVEQNLSMAVVLEDDAELTAEFPSVLKIMEECSADFDFIFLGRKFKEREIFAPCCSILPDLKLGRVGYTHDGMTGYIVSRKGAQKFISYSPRIVHPVDKEIHRFWANGLDLYGMERSVVVHADDGFSYLKPEPGQRTRYDDADTFYWRARRRFTKAVDSIGKRLAFPTYVKKSLKSL
jgi:glycosyl transferase family 25